MYQARLFKQRKVLMKHFKIYAVGGTGINVANRYLKDGRNGKFVTDIVGFDTSEANPRTDNLFVLERVEGAEGSGGDKKAHLEKYPDFAKQMLSKHAPDKINIVIFSTGGGTGAGLGPYLVREMLKRKIPVLSIVIGDTSSFNEQCNTVGTLKSLYNQTRLGHSVLFSYMENKPEITQGEVNATAVARIDNAIMMFNLTNERIDYADVVNFFYYNSIVDADPVLTQLTFLGENDLNKYDRKPVAALSLYGDGDSIKVPFENMLYRKGGVYGESFAGVNVATHAVLDHGNTLKSLEEMDTKREAKSNELSGQFRNKNSNAYASEADDDGMV
jgi:hypothetical protein